MEVTSVARRSVVLIFLYITFAHGQLHGLSAQAGASAYVPSGGDRAQAAAVANGIPQGELMLPPGAFIDDPNSYHQIALSRLPSSISYATAVEDFENPPPASMARSLIGAVTKTAYFLLSTFDLSDTDRHKGLRGAANDINASIDALMYYYNKLREFLNKIYNQLVTLPGMEFLIKSTAKTIYIASYIPIKLVQTLKSAIKRIVDGKHSPWLYAKPYPYA